MPSDQEVADLIAAVETHTSNVHTQARDLSFNELLNMHSAEPKELDISPDYQRLFRWSPGARSRFLESLLLEMPVPPIYVCLLYTSPSPRDLSTSRMPSSA